MALPENYQLSRRQTKCLITGEPFEDGQLIHTAIYANSEDDDYLREDYSVKGWQLRDQTKIPFSSWKKKWAKPETQKNEDSLSEENEEAIFIRLSIADDVKTDTTRYILALMLERSRILKEIDTQKLNDGILRIYEHSKSGETYLVKDPNLPLDQISVLQSEILESVNEHTNPL